MRVGLRFFFHKDYDPKPTAEATLQCKENQDWPNPAEQLWSESLELVMRNGQSSVVRWTKMLEMDLKRLNKLFNTRAHHFFI